ncbi:MAG TPA: SDR family oxidoreductase [Baekduia sp.]|uniref:SDR family oxidoreductase n=1 Tax=Baekduia sp. TaxID=2600305 RepID=UPI002D7729DF|nr:SDR family oxidoreductase [Baekduia sp.]HET6505432.1 SDR family oxidoreductase [Baekduia sp.]
MASEEIVVVTGASSGIGRATVRRFAGPGVALALIARGREGLEGARREVEQAGGRALVLPLDVGDAEAVDAAAQAVEDALGPIDIWINSAMATVFAFLEDVSPDEFRRATETTYFGSIWGIQAALKRMRRRDRGTIVQVGSAMAYQGIPLQAPYCGAKHGVQGVFESLRCELRHQRSDVHLTTVQLPGVNTPQFQHARNRFPTRSIPVAPYYQPEVAADAIHWAAHHRRREVWVGVPTVYTIWGNRLAPWPAERYLARTAVGGQLTDTPLDPDRPDNLYGPPPGDAGAHGPYDEQAHPRSLQAALARHRRAAVAAFAAAGAAGAAVAAGAFTRNGG